jgi:hypothetical protein
MLALIFLVAALVVFLIAAAQVPVSRVDLVALGLALLTLHWLVGRWS